MAKRKTVKSVHLMHRLDNHGHEVWRRNGDAHRDGGGPSIIHADGKEVWANNGTIDRHGNPAIICPWGAEAWYKKGNRHRIDGPAIISGSGEEWWRNDKQVDPGPIRTSRSRSRKTDRHSDR